MTLNILLMGGGNAGGGQMIFLLLIFVVMYVFMILPQTRKAKAQRKFREELKKGDKIVNLAGIHGKIKEVDDTTFVIEVEGGTTLRIEKSSISMEATQVVNKPAAEKTDDKK